MKCRSWDETLKRYKYFCDGFYFQNLLSLEKYEKSVNPNRHKGLCIYDKFFCWDNAEQEIKAFKDISNRSYFIGDMVKLPFNEYGIFTFDKDLGLFGLIRFECNNGDFKNIKWGDFTTLYILDRLEIIGNIREGVINE